MGVRVLNIKTNLIIDGKIFGKLGMVVHAYNPSTWKVDARSVEGQPWLPSEFKASLGYKRTSSLSFSLSLYLNTYTYIYILYVLHIYCKSQSIYRHVRQYHVQVQCSLDYIGRPFLKNPQNMGLERWLSG